MFHELLEANATGQAHGTKGKSQFFGNVTYLGYKCSVKSQREVKKWIPHGEFNSASQFTVTPAMVFGGDVSEYCGCLRGQQSLC